MENRLIAVTPNGRTWKIPLLKEIRDLKERGEYDRAHGGANQAWLQAMIAEMKREFIKRGEASLGEYMSGALKGAGQGAHDGLYAWVDGAVPFADPISTEHFHSPDDPMLKISEAMGHVSRDAWLAAAIPHLGTWAKNPVLYESGQKTLPSARFGALILAEDDARDTVQLARYANMMAEQGAQVALECQPELVKVMASCVGTKLIIPAGEPLPSHDFHATLLSLPAAFGTTLQTVPASRPYLGVDSRLSSLWRDRLNELGPAKIGVALRTDSGDVRGSIPPAHLTRFMAIEGVTLLDLQPLKQRSEAYDQMREQAPQRLLAIEELHPMSADVADRWLNIAAVLRNLDLLITADNIVAHVAGAIGVPTWLVLAQSPDPRWLLGRNDTPWYPTLRLFRQRLRGSWEEPFNEMAAILANRARKLREPAGVHGK